MMTSDPMWTISDRQRASKGQYLWYVRSYSDEPVYVTGDYLTVNAAGNLFVWVSGEPTFECLAGFWKCFFPVADRLKLRSRDGCFDGAQVPEEHQHDIPGFDI